MQMSNEKFFVSGWEDSLNRTDQEKHPYENPYKEVLWAAENGEFAKLKKLVESDQELVNAIDKDGYTPLHKACYGNHVKMVEYLLLQGADISRKTQMKWQPLHSCCHWSHINCAIRLIQAGADINATSDGDQTPLHIAASHGASYNVVQLLLMHPYINTELRNKSRDTALDIAKRSSKYYPIFEMADPAIRGIPDL